MSQLGDLATAALQSLKVELQAIKPLTGASWNVGELALAHVKITNSTGLPLREVVVETLLFGAAAKYQPSGSWDGNGTYIDELEPGEVVTKYCAFLKGVSAGSFTLYAQVNAEVIPFAKSVWQGKTYTVQPAP